MAGALSAGTWLFEGRLLHALTADAAVGAAAAAIMPLVLLAQVRPVAFLVPGGLPFRLCFDRWAR